MKLTFLVPLLTLAAFVLANWTPEDYEIFGLKDNIEKDLGSGTTFYSWLGLTNGPKSTPLEISKAYRKKSRQLHPDKFHSSKRSARVKAEERFQRLSLVGSILREQHLKKRYDYFLSNGFPKWKGTGYYYSRFRPGTTGTIIFLFLLISLFHFIAKTIGRKQDYKRIVALKEEVKKQAWNGSLIPPTDGSDRKVVNPINGKEFLVSSTGHVSLMETDEDEQMVLFPIEESQAPTSVSIKETLIVRFPVWIYNITVGRFAGEISLHEQNLESKPESQADKPKKKKPANRGEKIELPNGKVIYARSSGAKKRR